MPGKASGIWARDTDSRLARKMLHERLGDKLRALAFFKPLQMRA